MIDAKQIKFEDVLPEDDFDENAKIFPQRLMEILSEPFNIDAITWLPHGKAFIIINRQKFSDQILPKYFRKTKFTSFTRKLNRWNFTRVTRGPELGAYYHEFFQRGNEALCTQMYCKNDRAKFAVSKVAPNTASKTDSEAAPSKFSAQSPVEPTHHMSATELLHMSGMFPKPMAPAANPTLQARAGHFGQHTLLQKDPVTQSWIDNAIRAFQSPVGMMQSQSPEATLFRMQQLAAMQQQLQSQQGRNKSVSYNNFRASAA
jgi:hypothetical protein